MKFDVQTIPSRKEIDDELATLMGRYEARERARRRNWSAVAAIVFFAALLDGSEAAAAGFIAAGCVLLFMDAAYPLLKKDWLFVGVFTENNPETLPLQPLNAGQALDLIEISNVSEVKSYLARIYATGREPVLAEHAVAKALAKEHRDVGAKQELLRQLRQRVTSSPEAAC